MFFLKFNIVFIIIVISSFIGPSLKATVSLWQNAIMNQPKKQEDTDISTKCRVVTKISSYQVYTILLLGRELNG